MVQTLYGRLLPRKRSAGLQPALDVQTVAMVAVKRTLARQTDGYKPVGDRRSGSAEMRPARNKDELVRCNSAAKR